MSDMTAASQTAASEAWRRPGRDRPVSLATVMSEVERQVAEGDVAAFQPLALGFHPLDDVLNGGLRPGELLVIGGPFGVGKTIFALQAARNVVRSDPRNWAIYICYEHDPTHLMSRLLCLESAERGHAQDALTLRKLTDLMAAAAGEAGPISRLQRMPRYAGMLTEMNAYADRLWLVRADGEKADLDQIRAWVEGVLTLGPGRLVVVVDYLQKIPVLGEALISEAEATTVVTQQLKNLAVTHGIYVLTIAASDRMGLQAKRMRLADLRGSSALQYEADVGLVLNNKYEIVSREHLVYNPTQSEAMRNWVVMSVEKNRAGINSVDMEYPLDAAHFRLVTRGGFVRERLVDERVITD